MILYLLWLTLENPVSWNVHANMANSHCPRTTGHTSSALFNRRVGFDVTLHWCLTLRPLCTRPEWAAGLTQTRPIIFCAQWRMLHHGQGWDVYVNTCGVPAHVSNVVSVVVWTGHRECARFCSVFPAFICTYPPPLLCTSFPSAVLGKISSNLTPLHAGGLPQRMWDDIADGSPLWSIFTPVDRLDHNPKQSW